MSSISDQSNLYLLPGLGADARLFAEQRAAGLDVRVPAWIEPRRGESLADYGRRMAQAAAPVEPFVLGGMSLGAMMALEMARHLQPKAVVVIAGARSCAALPWWLRGLASVTGAVPPKAFRPIAATLMGLALRHERLSVEQVRLLQAMCRDADPHFFRWAAGAAARWRLEGDIAAPVFTIHGDEDRLLRSARVEADMVIQGGGHMINLTHAAQVTAVLKRFVRS